MKDPPLPGLNRPQSRKLSGPSASQRPDDPVHYAIHLVGSVTWGYPLPASFMIG
jgi:hypothetical protein